MGEWLRHRAFAASRSSPFGSCRFPLQSLSRGAHVMRGRKLAALMQAFCAGVWTVLALDAASTKGAVLSVAAAILLISSATMLAFSGQAQDIRKS